MRRLYALLLYLHPVAFRQRYREELLEAFDDERGQARYAGARGVLRLWRHLLADLIVSATRQRWVGRHRLPHLPPPQRRGFMETLLQDIRYACRQFVRRPAFTTIAALSLALAIGGNTLIFGLLDGFVFHPFAYPDPDRLVAVGATFPKVSSDTTYVEALSVPEYEDIRRSRTFSHIAGFDLGNRNVSGGDVPERVFTALLLDDLFPVMGMRPVLGRGFTAEELAPRGQPAAIISHRLWQSRFGGDPNIVGRAIRIGGQATPVVGVMPSGLVLIGTDLWIPWAADRSRMPRNVRQFNVLCRLAPDATLDRANVELATIARQVQQAEQARYAEYEGWRLTATPWAAALLQDVRPAAFILLGAVGLVLLIACANLANLMLSRSTSRQRELAVRLALGAGRLRIARQLLTESLLLALAGAAAGLLLAYLGLRSAGALIPSQFAMLGLEASLNGRVLGWSVMLATLTGMFVAILPALHASRTDPHESLKADGRTGTGRASGRMRQGLVVAEIALSVVLLLGAGLLLRSFLNLQRTDLGFDPKGVLTMRLTLPQQKYASGEAITSFFEELSRRVSQTPGVSSAGMVSQFPPLAFSASQIEVEGVAPSGTTLPSAFTTIASRDYFKAISVPLVRGRFFGVEDIAGAPHHVIVNQAFVSRYVGTKEPVGARVRMVARTGQPPRQWSEIVGVVGDTRNVGPGAPVRPEIFIPMEQGRDAWNQLFLVVRSSAQDAAALVPAVRSTVASIDPEQPVYMIQTMEEAVAGTSFTQRIAAMLVSIFAGVALVLAAMGIYGVMSYSVAARTQEIGVRMAVGAERADVLRLVLWQVARLTLIGLAAGVGLLFLASKPLAELLYGVTAHDPLTITAVSLTLGAIALLAAWGPAWRASRVDPIQALRYE